jgi:uncharacterized peroxidase-related enzyme
MGTILQPVTDHTAPEASRPILAAVRTAFGFVPNLIATFANSPTTLQGYTTLEGIWERGTLTSVERQLVLLTASTENACGYCSAAHATVAKRLHVDARTVRAVRTGAPIADLRLNALVALTRELVAARGHARQKTIDAFLAAGYRAPQVLEVLVGIALKTISNYLDHINPSEIDAAFAAEWQPAAQAGV